MINQNLLFSSINTDRDLASILDQFSEDSIESIIEESLKYKFAPYANRKPNLPYIINGKFMNLRENYTGSDHDSINTKEYQTYLIIINKICKEYGVPVLFFSFDSNTSETGLKTRLEAFYDMLEMRKK